jgi:hypothetical protein
MTDATDTFAELARRGHQVFTAAARAWEDAVRSMVESAHRPGGRLPDVRTSLDAAFDFATQMLAEQREFAKTVMAVGARTLAPQGPEPDVAGSPDARPYQSPGTPAVETSAAAPDRADTSAVEAPATAAEADDTPAVETAVAHAVPEGRDDAPPQPEPPVLLPATAEQSPTPALPPAAEDQPRKEAAANAETPVSRPPAARKAPPSKAATARKTAATKTPAAKKATATMPQTATMPPTAKKTGAKKTAAKKTAPSRASATDTAAAPRKRAPAKKSAPATSTTASSAGNPT